ncbi:MAG TPA: hypothetical protein VGS07_08225 [Thermoanaerobaculia bacterium]|nr:hypothetical protein [Thermoanaerobaculia bacterium]
MSERTYLDFLQDIVYCLEKAQSFIAGMTFEEFSTDEKLTLPSSELSRSSEKPPRGFHLT